MITEETALQLKEIGRKTALSLFHNISNVEDLNPDYALAATVVACQLISSSFIAAQIKRNMCTYEEAINRFVEGLKDLLLKEAYS